MNFNEMGKALVGNQNKGDIMGHWYLKLTVSQPSCLPNHHAYFSGIQPKQNG